MKSASFKILAFLVSASLVATENESLALRGGGGRGGGGGGRIGAMGGGGRAGGFSRPSASGGGFGGGGRVSRPQTVSRPSSSRAGGLAPNKNVGGGNINRSQVSSKIQSRPKGSGSALPSVAQGKKAGAGAGGNKGFPDVAEKAGAGQLAGKAQGARGGQLAGKTQGAQGGQLAGKLQGAQGGQLAGRLQGAKGGQLRSSLSPQQNQALANRQQYWNNWSKQNQGKLTNFQASRTNEWNNVHNFWNNRNPSNTFNKPEWNNYKSNVQNFRNNRSIEINNNIQNNFDNRFDGNWWGNCGWWHGPVYAGTNPWWWWGAATVATAGTFLALDAISDATYQPPVYDYGVNVVYQGDEVYVNGKPTATAKEYSQQATKLANQPKQQPPPPTPPEPGQPAEYLPLGVWAIAQEEKGDAYMFFQIAIDKNGVVTGGYENVLSGEKSPISGQVDKKTQRVAWKIGSNNTVIETGLQNLTQDVAGCLVHFGADMTQTWLLVRLRQPEMPTAPQTASGETKGS
jgi:hypothetical protein